MTAEDRYDELLNTIRRRDEVDPDEVRLILMAAGKTREDLRRDLGISETFLTRPASF